MDVLAQVSEPCQRSMIKFLYINQCHIIEALTYLDLVLKVLVDKVVTSAEPMVMERFNIETKKKGRGRKERGREGKEERSNFYSKGKGNIHDFLNKAYIQHKCRIMGNNKSKY